MLNFSGLYFELNSNLVSWFPRQVEARFHFPRWLMVAAAASVAIVVSWRKRSSVSQATTEDCLWGVGPPVMEVFVWKLSVCTLPESIVHVHLWKKEHLKSPEKKARKVALSSNIQNLCSANSSTQDDILNNNLLHWNTVNRICELWLSTATTGSCF